MTNITMDIWKNIQVLSINEKGYTKELNLISWNNGEPKLDIRTWYPDGQKCSKGITLTIEEGMILRDALIQYYVEREEKKEGNN